MAAKKAILHSPQSVLSRPQRTGDENRSSPDRAVTSLDAYARAQSDLPVLLRLFLAICTTVQDAHSQKIVHRDLKPSDVLVVDLRGEPQLLDFGLGLFATEQRPGIDPKQRGAEFMGTLPWAAPEQARGEIRETDARADVYSLGVMLYQMVSGGRFPYDVSGNPQTVLSNIITSEPAPLRQTLAARFGPRARRPEVLEAVIFKAISKQKEHRYQSAGDFARDIGAYLANKPITLRTAKPVPFTTRIRARILLAATASKKQRKRAVDAKGKRFRPPLRWPTIETIRSVYDRLSIRPSLPDWKELPPDRQDWFAEQVIQALLAIPKASSREVSHPLVFNAEAIAALQEIRSLLKQIASHFDTQPGAPPPHNPAGAAGGDNDDELRRIWLALKSEQKTILRFMSENKDSILSYKSIAMNLTLSRLPGDISKVRELQMMSNTTVAKHCKAMEKAPLSLICRDGDRTPIILTLRGNRIVWLHPGERAS